MVIHWPKPLPGWVVFGLLMVILLCSIFLPPTRRPIPGYDLQSVEDINNEPYVNDSLPHYKYQRIKDSFASVKRENNYFNKGASGFGLANFGLYEYDLDTAKESLLSIEGYDHDEYVDVENNKSGSVLTYPVWKQTGERSRGAHLEKKPIGIKYEEGKERWQGKVFVPVSTSVRIILTVLLCAILIPVFLVAFYCSFFIPVRFLYQLAKGKAFTEENIGNLYFTGWGLIAIGLLLTLLTYAAHLFVQAKIPPEIGFSYYAVFMKFAYIFIAGLSVLLLAAAFLQGLELKEESDLTV